VCSSRHREGLAGQLRGRPPVAVRCTASRASCSTAWAARGCPSTWTSTKIPMNCAADSARSTTSRAHRERDVVRAGVVPGLFSVDLLGGQARHAHDRTCRRVPEPGAHQPVDAARGRPAAMLGKLHRGLSHRIDGPGRELRDRRLSRGAAGSGSTTVASSTQCTRSPSRATCARCCRASSRWVRCLHDGQQDHRLGAESTG